jgi:thiol-disulfide isomerase/thioredoxin
MLTRTAGFSLILLLAGCYDAAAPQPAPSQPTPRSATVPGILADTDGAAGDTIAEAQAKTRQGDMEGALTLLEEALVKEPKNTRLLAALVQLTQSHGTQQAQKGQKAGYKWMQKSGDYLRQLMEQDKNLAGLPPQFAAGVLYNEACALAIGGQKEKALESLSQSLELGFDQGVLLDTDPDLASLRGSPEFKKLLTRRQEKFLADAKEAAKSLTDFSFELPDLDGKTVSLADYKGKVLIVDFWGTWCPPCRKEVPHFVELHKKYRDKGLEVVGINYERVPKDQVNETIKKFVEENSVTYTCVVGDEKTQQSIPELDSFPTTLFLDRAGKVRAKIVGYHNLADLEAIVTMLLGEK